VVDDRQAAAMHVHFACLQKEKKEGIRETEEGSKASERREH
jgi:hypothetical protein